jgi:hypothetical protein
MSVGKLLYSTFDDGEGEDAIDTQTYVDGNDPANSLQLGASRYVLAVLGTSTYWEQRPAGNAQPVYNKDKAKSPQSKDVCTDGESWW